MSEVAAVATATATPPAPAPAAAPARLSINQILENVSADGETVEVPTAETESAELETQAKGEAAEEGAELETEAEETTEEDPAKAAQVAQGDPFSDEALKTPEGIAKARQILNSRQAKISRREMAADRRHKKLDAEKAEVTQLREQLTVVNRNVSADLQTLQRGDSKAVMTAIGRLTGRDPVEVLTELNLTLANNGPRQTKETPEVAELKRELSELKQHLRGGAERAKAQEDERWIQNQVQTLVAQAAESAEHPHLAQMAADAPDTVAQAIRHAKVTHYNEHGAVLGDDECFGVLEEYLAHLRGGSPPPKKSGGAGQATSAGKKPAKPGSGRLRPHNKTISPGLATQSSGAQRDPTDEEIIESVARDKDYLASLFPGRFRR